MAELLESSLDDKGSSPFLPANLQQTTRHKHTINLELAYSVADNKCKLEPLMGVTLTRIKSSKNPHRL